MRYSDKAKLQVKDRDAETCVVRRTATTPVRSIKADRPRTVPSVFPDHVSHINWHPPGRPPADLRHLGADGGMCVRCSVVSRWGGIVAEAAVYRHVAPLAVSEQRSAPDALADEPGLFQRPLLADVLHIGSGL